MLNGAPRSGKSSIAVAMQDTFAEPWLHVGVDSMARSTPARWRPGIGLRPGGERPDLEPAVELLYTVLYESIAAHSRLGLAVVVDVGHHDDYSRPLGILPRAAARLDGLPAWFVGVRCPVAVNMERRAASPGDGYVTSDADGVVPEPVLAWERAVHDPGIYDLEVDTSAHRPDECAAQIGQRISSGVPPTAFAELARSSGWR